MPISSLADHIERYIKALLDQSEQPSLEIRRVELAKLFECVPSQINYVLKTRFNSQRGYIVESRRGGGGYIRIFRLEPGHRQDLYAWIYETVGERLELEEAEALLVRLVDQDYLGRDEAMLVWALLRQEAQKIDKAYIERAVAVLLRSMLLLLLHGD
ncbi:MAG: CtsR family transcriptional regulator [Firmicutes bacterium]|nr:CtsR family transcriptional regulator [Bacillota bacterium]